MVYHKASLVATRDFWRVLTNEVVPLQQLGRGFERMEEMEGMADKTYRLVLDRYPTNTKLLRSYGRFLESVKVRVGHARGAHAARSARAVHCVLGACLREQVHRAAACLQRVVARRQTAAGCCSTAARVVLRAVRAVRAVLRPAAEQPLGGGALLC